MLPNLLKGREMVLRLFVFSLTLLLFLTVLSTGWRFLSFEKIVFILFLALFLYAVMVIGEVFHKDDSDT